MTDDSDMATSTPPARAATTKASTDHSRCAECLWPFGPDLIRTFCFGREITLCRNPWMCWGRKTEMTERLAGDPL